MHRLLLLGAGKIGRMIARLLAATGEFDVLVADADTEALTRVGRQSSVETLHLNAADPEAVAGAARGRQGVISALSYRFNPLAAEAALSAGAHYFDLTEDLETTRRVREISSRARPGQLFMPQCGLAPGFVSICAHHLARRFESLDTVYMRVGALPQFPTNELKYNLTWSTDGLINEYCNVCEAIYDGRLINVLPLEGLESFSLDGIRYEAFNTSGGLGTLCETFEGRLRALNYKTVRYTGHRDLMLFLIRELRLGERRELLKELLESAIPITFQDVVVIFCTVTGRRDGQLVQMSDARKIYQQTIDGQLWSAIQVTTAAALCAVVDLAFQGRIAGTGFIRQEQVDLDEFLANRFGNYYRSQVTSPISSQFSDVTGAAHAS